MPSNSNAATGICVAIERLLQTATDRQPIGSIDDVLTRLVRRATCLSPPYESDFPILVDNLCHALTANDLSAPIGIRGTSIGIHSETTRIEFLRGYSRRFVFETPGPAYFAANGTRDDNPVECFEEYLVGTMTLFQVSLKDADEFDLLEFLPVLDGFCDCIGRSSQFDLVIAHFVRALWELDKNQKQ